MARIPETRGGGEVAERIRRRRPGGRLRPIDRVLLHSPPVADGWNTLLGTLRGGTALRPDLRELVVLRIAVLNGAAYEWDSHVADAELAGIGPKLRAALRGDDPPRPDQFDAVQRLVLALTDAMTRDITVPDDLLEDLRSRLGTSQLVELVVTVAAYNMVSRVIVALGVDSPAAPR
ncbi:carboxymuconolactone decarboxylase family protein [Actinoplanes sp. NPDC051851]|uniref:carboxymuconolactone decarboxylase family protein n=1 Tax=Actinoplanes sp. NPDC051851 TaxID=3154753 RepID=UPI003419B43F